MQSDVREKDFQSDILSIQSIQIIPTILDVICSTTGMGFAAIARVTEDRWITCSLLDKIQFGLKPGDELKVETTLCQEVRQKNKPVIIDHVEKDAAFCQHPTSKIYGFQSFISVPIIRRNGNFFGTVCAFDPKPAKLNTPEVIGMFNLFSDLISFHLQAVEQLELSEEKLLQQQEEHIKELQQKNSELQTINLELESFAHVASHDLQEPLRKVQTFAGFILNREYGNLTGEGKNYFDRLLKSVRRMQTLISDLIMYTQIKIHEQIFEHTSLDKIVEEIKQNYIEELTQRQVKIEMAEMCDAFVIPFQFKQLLQNLISNSIKFSKPGVNPVIHISSSVEKGSNLTNKKLSPEKNYCHVIVTDNGIGFDPLYSHKIFEIFQRLHAREEYEGTGIGLSIVKKIVENHKGFITATGEVDKGARFDIYIPQP